jgi:DNA polymerase III delta prime subunit
MNKLKNFIIIQREKTMDKTGIWTFTHEPVNFEDMVLNDDVRAKLSKVLKEVPNLMLVGPAGVGKGTFTHIFLKETGLDSLWVNCSDETSIDNIRTKVKSFATSLGITPLKIVVLNECDYISVPGQAMLRDLMEQVQKITRFILMCNYGHKVIPELQSRCQVVELGSPPLKDVAKFVVGILKSENVKIEKMETVLDVVKKMYPDIRSTINTLQLNTIDGRITNVKLENINGIYESLMKMIKNMDLDGIRKTLRSNTINYTELYQYLFDNVGNFKSPGDAIIEIAEAMYRDSIVAIKEINFISCVMRLSKNGCI